jgi:hypothetical protein
MKGASLHVSQTHDLPPCCAKPTTRIRMATEKKRKCFGYLFASGDSPDVEETWGGGSARRRRASQAKETQLAL